MHWTDEEIQILKNVYPKEGFRKTAKLLNRTLHSIRQKASELSLNKIHKHQIFSKEYLIEHYVINKELAETIANNNNTTIDIVRWALYKHKIVLKIEDRKQHRKPYKWRGFGDIPLYKWNDIKRSAKYRQIEFSISIEYAWDIFVKQNRRCALSGIELFFPKKSEYQFLDLTASLDRNDSSKGYVEGNVQWVHKILNQMKLNHSKEEFINWCKLVVENNT